MTGRTPFEGTLRELVDRQQHAPIPRADVSPVLDDLIVQMLQKEPAMRPQSMIVVQRMLNSVDRPPKPSHATCRDRLMTDEAISARRRAG